MDLGTTGEVKFIILLVILLLVIIFIQAGYPGNWVVIIAVVAALLTEILMRPRSEHLETITAPSDDAASAVVASASDDVIESEYGNITVSNDVDSTYQMQSDLFYGDTKTIDNSDVINTSLLRGSSLFLPNHAQGVTTTSSALLSSFTLAEPDPITNTLSYTTPMDDSAYNLDQALARKQQHRSAMNKKAIDGAVRSTKNAFQRVFKNELAETEARDWWSSEATDFETDFRAYD
jgi:hypothetical protein